MLILGVVLSMTPVTGHAQKSGANEDAKSSFIPDFRKQISSALLIVSDGFEINEKIKLKPDISASYIRNDEETTASTRYRDPVIKQYIHNPFYNSAVSISLPFEITQSLNIAPAITYAFSINDMNRPEYRGKSLINLVDKDSAIVYGGIHFSFSF